MVLFSLRIDTDKKKHEWKLLNETKPGLLEVETAQGTVTIQNCPTNGSYSYLHEKLSNADKQIIPLPCLFLWISPGGLLEHPIHSRLIDVQLNPMNVPTRAILEDIERSIIMHVTKQAPEISLAIALHEKERLSVQPEFESIDKSTT